MTRATVLQAVRQMRFEELYARRERRAITMAEAGEMLGVTERTFRRWSSRYEAEGAEGVQDRRIGRASARAVPVDDVVAMLTLYETRYPGWTVKHFHERWQSDHGGTRSYGWTKKTLQAAGQVVRAPRRGAHRKKRPRKPWPGMMLHQDGSPHEWGPGGRWDLIVTLDDATNHIYSAFFVEEEGTLSSLRGLREVIETQGLFSSLYTDRGSHYWYTEAAGGRVDKTRLTQVHRALQQLGITLIPAYSPEARGRSERAFRTLQDRLPKELALAGITEMAAANRYLTEQFLPQHNARFMVRATEPGTAFIPWVGPHLAEILCVQEERGVANDNTVRYQGLSLQIPQDPPRFHYVKVTVRVHAYPDGTLAVFHGPRCLARYHADGRLIEPEVEAHRRKTLAPRSSARPIVDPRATARDTMSAQR
ncbi:MAG: ISNCY family transposase [Nitrospirae bacterium]|nr:ISNCY family transposase [Nitrospirota bacterium]